MAGMARSASARTLLAIGVSVLALTGSPVLAQDQQVEPEAAETSATGNEIVVTAQFREQRLQDTPLAITAVNSAMLEARSQTNISEITAQA
ncbi:MAG TPA: hypothetical protein VMN03_06830, partial [Burkholderiales bacterium]|nr:hypothetical protein [Burkholderiales bacterium]